MITNEVDLLTFVFFFLTISVAVPAFLLPFGNTIIENIRKDYQETRLKALRITGKVSDTDLSVLVGRTDALIEAFSTISRGLIFVLLVCSGISVIVGLLSIVQSGLLFYRHLSKTHVITALLILQLILFYINVVVASVAQPNSRIDRLRQYMINNHFSEYVK